MSFKLVDEIALLGLLCTLKLFFRMTTVSMAAGVVAVLPSPLLMLTGVRVLTVSQNYLGAEFVSLAE